MITIVLLRTERGSHLGMISRAMKNFGLTELVLIDPKVTINDKEAVKHAKHALDVLKKAQVKKADHLQSFDYLIGTTAKLGTDYNLIRSPITPEQLFSKKEIYGKTTIALLLGPEGHGLSNHELSRCDFIVTIPSSKKYPTLNLANAATLLFYEYFKHSKKMKVNSHILPARAIEKRYIHKYFEEILSELHFTTPSKKKTQEIAWKKIIGKAFLTKREAYALLGLLKKIKEKMRK